MKLYFVDDDSEEAELFNDAIDKVDGAIEVVWYDSVTVAFNNLLKDASQPDAIFLDLNIPKISGKELLKMLRANPFTMNIPVIIYSTSISKKDVDDTSPFNVKFYLQKPESFPMLCLKLGEALTMLR